jgi:hypothetical protein
MVRTAVQTPLFWGEGTTRSVPFRLLKLYRRAGALDFFFTGRRPFRTSWFMVGITLTSK